MPELHSIAKEAAACRAAWAAMPEATHGAHIHHGSEPFETLTEPIAARIAYILASKPKREQALRLRLMRPVAAAARAEFEKTTVLARAKFEKTTVLARAKFEKTTVAALAAFDKTRDAAWAKFEKTTVMAHQRLCPTPDCPWDGQSILGNGD